jgi:single-strand DNA-binding protein
MLDALVSGKLIKTPELKTGASGKAYCQFLLSVATGEPKPTTISGIAFESVAQRIALLTAGDSLAVIGSLKPSEWNDKTTGETKHGLSVTVSNSLSTYDISKKRS